MGYAHSNNFVLTIKRIQGNLMVFYYIAATKGAVLLRRIDFFYSAPHKEMFHSEIIFSISVKESVFVYFYWNQFTSKTFLFY